MVAVGHVLLTLPALGELPLQSTDDNSLIVIGAFVVGLILMWSGVWRYRMSRLILNTPTEKARSVSIGRTELEGEAIPHEYVFDRPFSPGQCLYAEYEIEEYQQGGMDDDGSWETIYENTVAAPFRVDDGTGQVLVTDTHDATISLSNEYARTYRSETDEIWEFLNAGTVPRDGEETSDVTHVPRGQLNSHTVVPGVTDVESSDDSLLHSLRTFDPSEFSVSAGTSDRPLDERTARLGRE